MNSILEGARLVREDGNRRLFDFGKASFCRIQLANTGKGGNIKFAVGECIKENWIDDAPGGNRRYYAAELSIPAGLQDRVAQAYNHPVFMDFDRRYMQTHGYGRYEAIELPPEINFYVAYRTDLAEGSEILHSRLRDDYNARVPQVLAAMEEWSDLTVQMKNALKNGDYSTVQRLIDRNFDLRSEVCSGSISSRNRQMIEVARSTGASAKFTGSGGAIVGTFEDEAMFENLRRKLKIYGVEIVKPNIVRQGGE